ncbi:MAG: hypothetical protein IJG62_07335 [Synergistaceae bacterium]|nr:hypothetical protein [Synergistaceae bacterium]MBQ4419862.1 hypothetical protein [Synergistaceae bacterium]MBQ6739336.1 hypothetical protein [Synergistaceae bacterium]MBQ6909288.1 hypothetical protein [Synergistaceae bacterium]MBQ9581559.1 hypothetical protein [Synergistaceae bacterium]
MDPEKLKAYIHTNPDAFLSQIADAFHCCPTAIRKALIRLKITRKKRQNIMNKTLQK